MVSSAGKLDGARSTERSAKQRSMSARLVGDFDILRKFAKSREEKKPNRQIVRKTMQMPIVDELLDQISMKISEGRGKPLIISTIELKYAFGQILLHRETAKPCVAAVVGGKATGHYRFKKGFYGLADMPIVFQSKLDRVLGSSPTA